MKWVGGTGRLEGRHSFPTFKKILTRTHADPDDPAPEAAMPQRAWETFLRDAVQGLRRPYTPETLRQWLQTTHPQAWAISTPQTLPPLHHQHTGKGKGKGKARGKGARRGAR